MGFKSEKIRITNRKENTDGKIGGKKAENSENRERKAERMKSDLTNQRKTASISTIVSSLIRDLFFPSSLTQRAFLLRVHIVRIK